MFYNKELDSKKMKNTIKNNVNKIYGDNELSNKIINFLNNETQYLYKYFSKKIFFDKENNIWILKIDDYIDREYLNEYNLKKLTNEEIKNIIQTIINEYIEFLKINIYYYSNKIDKEKNNILKEKILNLKKFIKNIIKENIIKTKNFENEEYKISWLSIFIYNNINDILTKW